MFRKKYKSLENAELLNLYLTKGDVLAFQNLYLRFEKRLWGFFRKGVNSENDCKDLIQTTYEKLLTSKGVKENNIQEFEFYLLGIANNTLKRYYSNKKKNTYSDLELVQNPNVYNAEDIFDLDKYRQSELELAWLKEAISQLPPKQRMAIQLQLECKSYSVIAEAMDMTETGVGSLLNRAKNSLKKKKRNDHER